MDDKKNDVSVFVTQNDVVVTKSASKEDGEEPEEGRQQKYFTERKIQSILNLDTWMYTLSNHCSNIQNEKRSQLKKTKKSKEYTSLYSSTLG